MSKFSSPFMAKSPLRQNKEGYHVPLGGVQDVSEIKEDEFGHYVENLESTGNPNRDRLDIPPVHPTKPGDLIDETLYESLSGIGKTQTK